MTLGSLPSMTATTELVVPRSIPMILDMLFSFCDLGCYECPVVKFLYDSKPESSIVNSGGASCVPCNCRLLKGGYDLLGGFTQMDRFNNPQQPAWISASTEEMAVRERAFFRSVYGWMF